MSGNTTVLLRFLYEGMDLFSVWACSAKTGGQNTEMTVLEVVLGVGLVFSVIWWAVDHLFKIIKIEELEDEISGYESLQLYRQNGDVKEGIR